MLGHVLALFIYPNPTIESRGNGLPTIAFCYENQTWEDKLKIQTCHLIISKQHVQDDGVGQ